MKEKKDSKSTRLLIRVFQYIRELSSNIRHLNLFNREFSIFLVFLAVSIIMWFISVFHEETKYEIKYLLTMKNVPQNVIFTNDVPDTIVATISDEGWEILRYMAGANRKHILNIDFANLASTSSWKVAGGGSFTIDNNMLKRSIANSLTASTKINNISPSSIDVYYSTGESKKVPVKFNGKITASPLHEVCDITIKPDSVDIFTSYTQLDTINAVYTEFLTLKNLEDTTKNTVNIKKMTGVKTLPSKVNLTIAIDLITEKKLSLPIYSENLPDNMVLRTFPLRADVTFHVKASQYDKVNENDFVIAVDYNSIKAGDSKCNVILRSCPKGVTNVKITPQTVDYVIEQTSE